MRYDVFLFLFSLSLSLAVAGNHPKTATAVRTPEPPHIDGVLDESVWSLAKPEAEFLQRDPDEGTPASERTEIRILYDDEALYFGCTMNDSEPSKIMARLARRDDEIVSDFISLRIDSYNDSQTAFEFTVNAAGVKTDIIQYSNGNEESASWDAVWDVETRITDQGWIAEIKIPFQALRYTKQDRQHWGLQIIRHIPRKNEDQHWALIRRGENGTISRFGSLVGIDRLPPAKNFEIMPYAAGKSLFPGISPMYPDGRDVSVNAGLDLKYAPMDGITVDATFNPDFGQVEADPALLNLSSYETFYPEKRPFFIEGSQILRFVTFGGDYGPGLFYSRRIGTSLDVDVPEGGSVLRAPQFATILGAAKLSGKFSNGLSLGALEAVTREETAEFSDSSGKRYSRIVAPLTNYSLFRLRQDVFDNSNVGVIATSVNRKDGLPAFTGGTDWNIYLSDNVYRISGFVAGSQTVNADSAPISGSAGKLQIGKEGGDHWRGSVGIEYTSKNYNINDIGFFMRPNDYGTNASVSYIDERPNAWTRMWVFSFTKNYRWNFDGAELDDNAGVGLSAVFSNYWEASLQYARNTGQYDDRETRNNSLFAKPRSNAIKIVVESNSYNPFVAAVSSSYEFDERRGRNFIIEGWFEIKLIDNLTWELSVEQQRRGQNLAWVKNIDDPASSTIIPKMSIFADRTTLEYDFSTRASYIFTRNLTLQLYLQMFFAKGTFENVARMTSPTTFSPYPYIAEDFNETSFHSNLVLRWEYLPGSTLFLVWSHTRTGEQGTYMTLWQEDMHTMFSLQPENVVLLKLSYWFSI